MSEWTPVWMGVWVSLWIQNLEGHQVPPGATQERGGVWGTLGSGWPDGAAPLASAHCRLQDGLGGQPSGSCAVCCSLVFAFIGVRV